VTLALAFVLQGAGFPSSCCCYCAVSALNGYRLYHALPNEVPTQGGVAACLHERDLAAPPHEDELVVKGRKARFRLIIGRVA